MKKLTKFTGIFILGAMLNVSNPVVAQTTTTDNTPSTTTNTSTDRHDDTGKWGLAGLLGLLGLLGLRKKDHVVDHNRTTNVNR